MDNVQNRPINPEHIYHTYAELFPNEFEFLVLYNLYSNYPSAEIQYAEVKQTIVDTSRLPFLSTGKDRQTERTFKGLLRIFIERVPSKSDRFLLTPDAEKIVEIAIQRINNPYLKYPLKETFETYFKLPDNVNEGIHHLQGWYKFGFQNNARQVVIGHLDGLKLAVDDAIKALNQILDADNLSAMQMLEQFSENFQVLGDKARQITEAIKMKVDVHYQLRDIVDSFVNISDREQSEPTQNESEYFKTIQQNIVTAAQIKEEVNIFFEKVDKQLDLISMRMVFAGNKITELQESLRAQSQYKINLKKMLVYLLEHSSSDIQHWVKLPGGFPVRSMVQEKFRFRTLRYYDMGFLKRTKPFDPEIDVEYEADQRQQFELELKKQALIQQHCEQAQELLNTKKKLDLTHYIFEVMKQDDGLEIGVQTGYEFIRNLPLNNTINIKEELQSDNVNNIHVWKVMIENNQDSGS